MDSSSTLVFIHEASSDILNARSTASKTMVDYSKWDNLDSDSDSGSEKAAANQRKQTQVNDPSSRKAAEEKRGLDQAEVLRYCCTAVGSACSSLSAVRGEQE